MTGTQNLQAMGKLRSVNTHFWQDGYSSTLKPVEKLLFLYLLTAPASNVAGVYEVTVRQIAFDTGLKESEVYGILGNFGKAGKVRYLNGYVILVNHHKNQKLNPSMEQARQVIVKALPADVRKAYEEAFAGKVTTVELPPAAPPPPPTPVKDLAARTAEFHATVFTQENAVKYGKPMLQAFYQYWSEPNRSGTKMLCELKQTFHIAGRLATWASRETKGRPQGGDRIYREE